MTNLFIQRSACRRVAGFRIFNLKTGSSAFPASVRQRPGRRRRRHQQRNHDLPSDCALLNNTATNNGGGIQNFSTFEQLRRAEQPRRRRFQRGRGGGINNDGTMTALNCVIREQ